MKLLQELIACPSESGKEKKIQQYITSYARAFGIHLYKVNKNVVLFIPGGNRTKAMILNAHVDTVSAGNGTEWNYSPYVGTQKDGLMYGLGASDEKAAIAAFLLVATYFSKQIPPCDLFLTFVVSEETDGSGTNQVMTWFAEKFQRKYQQIAGILGEPTGLQTVETAHKGNYFLSFSVNGDSGHGSAPQSILTHAVFSMYKVMEKLQLVEKDWQNNYEDQVLGKPSIGIATSITAGNPSVPNKFPELCSMTCDIRTTPKLHDRVLGDLRVAFPGVTISPVYPPIPYGYTDPGEAIVRVAQKVTGALVTASPWSSDLCFFTRSGIPAIVFGPGEPSCIHKPNEYCEIKKVEESVELYNKIIIEFSKNK